MILPVSDKLALYALRIEVVSQYKDYIASGFTKPEALALVAGLVHTRPDLIPIFQLWCLESEKVVG